MDFGGGVSLKEIKTMTDGIWFNQCEFIGNCNQSGHGGGISCYIDGGDGSENDRVVFRETNFSYNCQVSGDERHGGGMFHRDTRRRVDMYNCNFTNNYAHGLTAGGAGISTEGHLLLDNCNFNGNMADNSFGGALYCRPWTYESDNIKRLFVEIKGGSFTNNNCTWTEDSNSPHTDLHRGSGGAIYVSIHRLPGDTLATYDYIINLKIQDNCLIANNHADRNGGAINISGTTYMQEYLDAGNEITSDLEINSAIIHDNTTGKSGASWTPAGSEHDDGGAVYLSYTNLKMTGTNSQVKVYDNTALKNGGAFCIHKGNILMDGGTLGMEGHPNHAVLGGGFYVFQGSVEMYDGLIGFNQASSNGGGGYVDAGGSVFMDGGEIHDNTAINGGGMFVNGGTFTLYDGHIHGNDATTYGGGVYMNGGNFYHVSGEVGKSYQNPNTAVNGAGVYMNGGNYSMRGGYINGNAATADGGGIYMNSGDFTLRGGTIGLGLENLHNEAVNGAGVYMHGGNFRMKAGFVHGNKATGNGGGVYSSGGTCEVTGGKIGSTASNYNEAVNGGGIYSAGGTVSIDNDSLAVSINYNKATNGGGIYTTTGGSITIEKTVASRTVEIRANKADNNGGGVFAGGNITISGGNILRNESKVRGGGVFVDGGTFNFNSGVIGGTTSEGNCTTDNSSYGGGIYMNSGTANILGGSISGNYTDSQGMGGGIFMNGGTCTLSSGATIGGDNANYANNAKYGGGLYSAGGDITVKGGHIDYNTATDGGGIYSNGPDATVLITKEGSALSYMLHNAAVNGGGIYANRGTVEFTDGNVNYNYASNGGGGMYVNDEGTLYLKGNAVLSRNHVPTGKDGGGVYLRGTVVVGDASKAQSSILAEDNFAFTTDTPESYTPDRDTRNNIYLPEPVANPYTSDTHRDVITVIENGIGADSHVGFSVPRNHVPVIYCDRSATSWDYLDRFTTGPGHDLNTRLFDDTERYLSVHYTGWPEAFDPDHVYLYGFWPEAVKSLDDVPDDGFTVDGNTVTIKNEEGLAWLISYVNGLNDSEPHNSADLVVNLEADVDMKDFGWVPIGFKGIETVTPRPFNGTFNGNGHTIEGVNGMVYGQGDNGVVDYGLFGYVTGGLIQDVFVKGMEYFTDNSGTLILGGLVGEKTDGIIGNSEVQSKLVAQNATTLIGGLVGKQDGGMLHSSIGIADMEGGRMGGLIGENSGDLYNSFANAKFTSKDNTKYAGGLVAVNNGTVENCYVRLRGEAPGGNFGILVGNNEGEVNFCYAPSNMTNYKAAGIAPSGHGNYGVSFLPYLYCHRDTQVSLLDDNGYVPEGDDVDKQMLIALNNWVNEMSTEDMTFTKWGRPWQESDDNKPLNDDYPILKMPLNDAVAAEQGDPYLYYGPIDTLLTKYTAADEAIWMYRSNANVNGENADYDAKLYIAEDVVLINSKPLKAYVGITLDNSAGVNGANPQGGVANEGMTDATDWHMISTPLRDAPLGIDYNGDEATHSFSWGHPDGMPYYRFYPKDNENNGYFPGYKFGIPTYPSTDATIVDGNYYTEWDFYAYYEPEYHWINFKRNSASHWHMDDEEHDDWQIAYTNEEMLVPGKGYFAATREETFLQCYGTLNYTNEVTYNLTQTEGVPRHGYNLIGNPYQAYLNFNTFAETNVDDVDAIWDDLSTASYTILDEDSARYVTFAYQGSDNPAYAGQYIYPHQGFFVLLRDRNTAKAYFQKEMRNATAEDVTFRNDGHVNYPLVNLYVKEASGNSDMVTVELGRPDNGGAPLMKGLRAGNGKIWCRYNDEDYSIAYTQPGITEVSIRFETVEDTEYTLRWDTYNGEFSYLHLIDNMTGADVDCLSESSYRFSSRTSDYASRFRLVFGYTGIEEDTEAEAMQDFAFMTGDELVVTGEGVLQVFDVNGRLVASRELHGVQSTVSLPDVSNGVYVLRLTEGKQSRVQKMVISK